MSNFQANVPLVNTKFVDDAGYVTESWFIFLIQLWRRTGGTTPSGPSLTVADVLAIEETTAVHGVGISDNLSSFPTQVTYANPPQSKSSLGEQETMAVPQLASKMADMVFAPILPQIVDETFTSGVDFTAGTTTTLTLKESFSSSPRLWIFFDAAFQGDDQYTLTGTSLTFSSVIPVGTNKVYLKGIR